MNTSLNSSRSPDQAAHRRLLPPPGNRQAESALPTFAARHRITATHPTRPNHWTCRSCRWTSALAEPLLAFPEDTELAFVQHSKADTATWHDLSNGRPALPCGPVTAGLPDERSIIGVRQGGPVGPVLSRLNTLQERRPPCRFFRTTAGGGNDTCFRERPRGRLEDGRPPSQNACAVFRYRTSLFLNSHGR